MSSDRGKPSDKNKAASDVNVTITANPYRNVKEVKGTINAVRKLKSNLRRQNTRYDK